MREPLNNSTEPQEPEKVEKHAPEGITTRSPIHNFVRGALSGAGLNAVNEYTDKIKEERQEQADFKQQQKIDQQKRDNELDQTANEEAEANNE